MRLYFALLLDQVQLIDDLGDLRAGQRGIGLEGGSGHTVDDLRVDERHHVTVGAVGELALGLGLGKLVELGSDLAELETGDTSYMRDYVFEEGRLKEVHFDKVSK